MPDEKGSGFSEGYVAGPTTAAPKPDDATDGIEPEISKLPGEPERYGTGKPTRKVVRAKTIADN